MLATLAGLWLWALLGTALLLVIVIAAQSTLAGLVRLGRWLSRVPALHGGRPALQR